MTFPRMRVWVFGLLFVAWLGFLAYLAARTHGQIVVARPQIERSNLIVVASLIDADGRPASQVRVVNVLFAKRKAWKELAGQTLDLRELAFFSANQGWSGPGDYVLPVTRKVDKDVSQDEITRLPLTPGFFAATSEMEVAVGKQPDALAARLSELTGTPLPRMRELCKGQVVAVWNVPNRSEKDFSRFDAQIGEVGGEVLDRKLGEGRIYRATSDVIAQVNEVIGR